jgi:DNA polymerase-3 subunit epsilon
MSLRPIFYDTETTGVKPEKDRVIELAAYDPERNRTFVQLLHPGCPIPPEASKIHNITDAMVQDAPTFGAIIDDFVQFCEGDVVLIAHNNDQFDIHFLRQEFSRHQRTLPPWNFFDTLKWARRYRPDLPRHSLQFLREVYGIVSNNAHRALDDVMVLHQVFKQMTDDLPIATVCRLLNEAGTPPPPTAMPFGKHQGKPLDQVPRNYILWLNSSGALNKPENQPLRESFNKLGLLTEAATLL